MPRNIIHHPRYLGENLRRLRRSRDWTVDRLALAAGLSKGYVSLIESGKRTPHWTVVMKVAHVLGTTLCEFFTEAEGIPPAEDGIRSRREDRIFIEESPAADSSLVVSSATYILTPFHQGLRSEVVEIIIPPHTQWTPEAIAFAGHVSCCGTAGRLLLETGATEYVMHPGETLAYDASVPHILRNYTDDRTCALLTITPVAL